MTLPDLEINKLALGSGVARVAICLRSGYYLQNLRQYLQNTFKIPSKTFFNVRSRAIPSLLRRSPRADIGYHLLER